MRFFLLLFLFKNNITDVKFTENYFLLLALTERNGLER